MGQFKVNLNFRNVEDLKYIDLSNLNQGLITIKSNRDWDFKSNVEKLKYTKFNAWFKSVSIELFLDNSETVAVPFMKRTFIEKMESLGLKVELSRFNFKSPIRGTHKNLLIHFKLFGVKSGLGQIISKGDELCHLNFMPYNYWNLIKDGLVDGVRPAPVGINLFINGKFKPWNKNQIIENGLQMVMDNVSEALIHDPKSVKFYELNYCSYSSNMLNEDGTDRLFPLQETVDEIMIPDVFINPE